jgi:hypothetical protein
MSFIIRRYKMKYEIPVCEMLKLDSADVLTTSGPIVDVVPEGTDSPVIDANDTDGVASN